MKQFRYILASFLFIAVVAAIGFKFYNVPKAVASEGGEAAPEAPQAMPVDMGIVKAENIQIWKNFSGHVVAVNQAEIRPQVSGRITEIRFEDGQHVEKDDVLVVIDPRPYEASLNQAQAELEAAKTQAALAEKEYQRAKKLIQRQAISQSLMDERTNSRQAAAASVQSAQARLEIAQINLDYAHVKAPISGKVSRAEITEGNLVQAGMNAPLLTSIVSDDSVYVDFEIDERTYISSVKTKNSGDDVKTPVRVKLSSSDDLEFKGNVHSFDNRIDPASGTIRARAIFDNKDGLLLPGMSVSVLMGNAGDEKRILISERAIGTDQDRKFVFIVNDQNMTEYREVKIGESVNGKRVVLSGLKDRETVITEGLVRIRPGMPVMPKTQQTDQLPQK